MSIAVLPFGPDETGPPPLDFVALGWNSGLLTNAGIDSIWGRDTGEFYMSSAIGGYTGILYVNAHEEDVEITTTIRFGTVDAGIALRMDAGLSNGWLVYRDRLVQFEAGVPTTRDTWTAIPSGTSIVVVGVGNSIQVYSGATLVGSWTSSFQAHGTLHGPIVLFSNTGVRFDSVVISNVPVSVDAQSSAPEMTTQAAGRVFGRQRPPVAPIDRPQYGLVIDREPYHIVDGLAVDRPMVGASSSSVVYPRSFSDTANLGAELDLGLNEAHSRWLADVGDVITRSDLGSDVTEWTPHFGSDPGFKFHAATAPYVDPSYDYWASHNRKKITQAMIFDGAHWGQSLLGSSVSAFTWVVVAMLHHPNARIWQDVLASPSSAVDPVKAVDATLRYHDGKIQSFVGGKLSEASLHPPLHRARLRPTILVWGEDAHSGMLGVITAHGRHFHDYHHPASSGYDLRMLLGVNGSMVDVDHASQIDVLDISYFTSKLTVGAARRVVNKLNHVYGVVGR